MDVGVRTRSRSPDPLTRGTVSDPLGVDAITGATPPPRTTGASTDPARVRADLVDRLRGPLAAVSRLGKTVDEFVDEHPDLLARALTIAGGPLGIVAAVTFLGGVLAVKMAAALLQHRDAKDQPTAPTQTKPRQTDFYESQRDNLTSYSKSLDKAWAYDRDLTKLYDPASLSAQQKSVYMVADRMCNVTSLAMNVEAIVGDRAKACRIAIRMLKERHKDTTFDAEKADTYQFEDVLDVVIQREYGVGAESAQRQSLYTLRDIARLFALPEYQDDSHVAGSTLLDYGDTYTKGATDEAGKERSRDLVPSNDPQWYFREHEVTVQAAADGKPAVKKTVEQLSSEGSQLLLYVYTVDSGGHYLTLHGVHPDGVTLDDPYSANVNYAGFGHGWTAHLYNEQYPVDRMNNATKLQRLLGGWGDGYNYGSTDVWVERRKDMATRATASAGLSKRFQYNPEALDQLHDPNFYWFKWEKDNAWDKAGSPEAGAADANLGFHPARPLYGKFGKHVFYDWADCKAMTIPRQFVLLTTKVPEPKV